MRCLKWKATLDNRLIPVKYINDPIYGGIPITQIELELIDTKIFQRLRGLRQLARVNFVFPAAEHSRYVHSLGVLYIMGLMTDHLMKISGQSSEQFTETDAVKMRIAALLHDIGHYPFSHLGENAYGYCAEVIELVPSILSTTIKPAGQTYLPYLLASSNSKLAHHEQLGKYIVSANIEISTILKTHKLDPIEIGEIFTGEIGSRNMVYSQLLHSSLDADRLDYLLRDSFQTGVKYGLVDLQYLIRLLRIKKSADFDCNVLAVNKKGQHVAEHFLMSRYFHYSQVIFHKTNSAFEGAIKVLYIKLLLSKKFRYNTLGEIKAAINEDEFINFNDSLLENAFEEYSRENMNNDTGLSLLYPIFRDRVRPKVVFEMKDLYEESPQKEFSVLKWTLKRYPEKITELLGTDNWGYQIVPVAIEKIQSHNKLSNLKKHREEELREAVKLVDLDTNKITYLAEDSLSVISRLSNYKSEFIRIYILEQKNKEEYEEIKKKIFSYIQA